LETVSEAFSGFSPTLIMNGLGIILGYMGFQFLSAYVKNYVLYMRIRSSSLGYQSRIMYSGTEYKLMGYDRRSAKLVNHAFEVYIPLIVWEEMIKVLPLETHETKDKE
jgi:hypothetical protein